MPPKIKDEEVTRQARELAQLTGCSMTEAVRAALSEKRATVRTRRPEEEADDRLRRLLQLGRQIRADLGSKAGTSEHDDLCDADGLPS